MGMGSVLGAGSYMVRTLSRLPPSFPSLFCATILIAVLCAALQESHSILGAGSVLPAWQRIPTGQVQRALSPQALSPLLARRATSVSSLVHARARSGWATRPSTFGILPKRSLISLISLLPITQYVHLSSPSVRACCCGRVQQWPDGDGGNSPICRFCQSSTPTNSTCQATPTSTPRRRAFRSATKSSLSPVKRAYSSPRTTRRRCQSTSVPPRHLLET